MIDFALGTVLESTESEAAPADGLTYKVQWTRDGQTYTESGLAPPTWSRPPLETASGPVMLQPFRVGQVVMVVRVVAGAATQSFIVGLWGESVAFAECSQ